MDAHVIAPHLWLSYGPPGGHPDGRLGVRTDGALLHETKPARLPCQASHEQANPIKQP